jgi:hypothetical protein
MLAQVARLVLNVAVAPMRGVIREQSRLLVRSIV